MQIGNTKYRIGTKSWKDRTPVLLKFGCDVLLFVSLVATTLWPEIDWVLKVGVFLKLLSNFISEHMPQQVQQDISDNKDNASEQ